MPRKLTLTLEPNAGSMSKYYLWIDKVLKKSGGFAEKGTWSGDIGDIDVSIQVRVYGIQGSKYKLGIDLPGTINDQTLTITLPLGSHDFKITI